MSCVVDVACCVLCLFLVVKNEYYYCVLSFVVVIMFRGSCSMLRFALLFGVVVCG